MWFLAIYLLGGIISYFTFRYNCRRFDGYYTRKSRTINILACSVSWIMVIIALVVLILETSDDKPAKW